MADWVTVVRLVHIMGAALWFGGGLFAVTMIMPAVKAAGPAGKGFMLHVARAGGFGRFFGPASGITVLGGILLYWNGGYASAPFANAAVTTLTLGSILGILAGIEGAAVSMPAGKKLQKLANEVGPQGPTPSQAAELERLVTKVNKAGLRGVIVIAIVFLAMAGRTLFV